MTENRLGKSLAKGADTKPQIEIVPSVGRTGFAAPVFSGRTVKLSGTVGKKQRTEFLGFRIDMPYYAYLCNKGHETEVEQPIKADALKICPKKGCRCKAKRLISRTSFQLKGNGWYAGGYVGPSNVGPSKSTKSKKKKKE
jgi:putative FmdB family regulatory protein